MNSKKKREKIASKNSQFDPSIHDLGRQGYGFQMKKNYKSKPGELSGRNLPFTAEPKFRKKNDT